ncbi:hypothetical protein A0H81_04928 [Grifola frondosa]|uniref:Uncharacterized protein n=1 Tax=Grifola frondosa TaxID=5627 RepID=A0A1C7MKA9_GRIFR|nr:hypothetical protein A0H81_04928 [Grifola frondosa]
MVKYYPEELTVPKFNHMVPKEFKLTNWPELERLQDIEDRKRRGKGAPKKAKTEALQLLQEGWKLEDIVDALGVFIGVKPIIVNVTTSLLVMLAETPRALLPAGALPAAGRRTQYIVPEHQGHVALTYALPFLLFLDVLSAVFCADSILALNLKLPLYR